MLSSERLQDFKCIISRCNLFIFMKVIKNYPCITKNYILCTQYVWKVAELNFCSNSVTTYTTKASYSTNYYEYVYTILVRLVTWTLSYIRLHTMYSRYIIRACNMEERSIIKLYVRFKTPFVEIYYMIKKSFG